MDLDLDGGYTKEQLSRLRHHYAYWEHKWGWDPCNPDVDQIRRRWQGSELCWASDPARRAAGREIIRSFELVRR